MKMLDRKIFADIFADKINYVRTHLPIHNKKNYLYGLMLILSLVLTASQPASTNQASAKVPRLAPPPLLSLQTPESFPTTQPSTNQAPTLPTTPGATTTATTPAATAPTPATSSPASTQPESPATAPTATVAPTSTRTASSTATPTAAPASTQTATPTATPNPSSTATPATASTPTTALEPVGQTGNWNMIFHDEFAGNTLDTSKWNTCFFNFHVTGTQDCTHDQSELELYQPENVMVNNGVLNLTAQKQNVTAGGETYNYTSGMISSGPATDGAPAKFAFQYGYMEMRAKVPAGQGFWPAFWTLAADESYPPEIDVFEILGNATTVANMHYHYPDGSDEGTDVGSEWTGPDFSAGWHTFAVDWEPGSLTWYVDGVARFQTSNNVTSKPQYLIANLAVGGGWPGNPDASTPFPSALQIDYIRVWQQG